MRAAFDSAIDSNRLFDVTRRGDADAGRHLSSCGADLTHSSDVARAITSLHHASGRGARGSATVNPLELDSTVTHCTLLHLAETRSRERSRGRWFIGRVVGVVRLAASSMAPITRIRR